MPFINDAALDLLLAKVDDDGEELHICSQEPTTATEAETTYSLGEKIPPTIGVPEDRTPNGRKVVITAITDGVVTATGTATHWAIVKTSATAMLLATGALASSQAVTNGNTFTLTQFEVGVPDAV